VKVFFQKLKIYFLEIKMVKKEIWEIVLLKLFEENPKLNFLLIGKGHKMPNIGTHYFAYDLGIGNEEFKKTLSFLINHKLIKNIDFKDLKVMEFFDAIEITEKGFNVALELRKHYDSKEHNNLILFFSAILAISALADFTNIFYGNNNSGKIIFSLLVLFLLLMLYGKKLKNYINNKLKVIENYLNKKLR